MYLNPTRHLDGGADAQLMVCGFAADQCCMCLSPFPPHFPIKYSGIALSRIGQLTEVSQHTESGAGNVLERYAESNIKKTNFARNNVKCLY